METLNFILAIYGAIPTVIWMVQLSKRYIFGIISWNTAYSKINHFVETYRTDHKEPATIIGLGYGGLIIGTYLQQFFPQSQFIHIPLVRDSKTGVRELSRQDLNPTNTEKILIVSGIHESGLSLSSVMDNLVLLGVPEDAVQTYAFLNLPHSNLLETDEKPKVAVNYYSIQNKNAKLPWYVSRSPSTNTIMGQPKKGFPLISPKTLANIKKLSLDFSQSIEKIDLRSDDLKNILIDFITASASKKSEYNILIAGPGAIGKSEFAKFLCEATPDSTYLPLDSSVVETEKRDIAKIDGYSIKAYNLDHVNTWLNLLNDKKYFEVAPYDHSTRKCTGILQVNGGARIRFLEWVFALHRDVNIKKDLTIIIDAPDEARYNFLYNRVVNIRKEALNDSILESIKQRFHSTNKHINPTLTDFDIRFILDRDWKISRIDCNIPEVNKLLQNRF